MGNNMYQMSYIIQVSLLPCSYPVVLRRYDVACRPAIDV
jgi:hypothetical protein